MKIITNDAVYVMKNDLKQLFFANSDSMFSVIFGNTILIINDSNRYEFERFDGQREMDFFKGIDWMVDYNEVKDLSKEELEQMCENIADERCQIAHEFRLMPEDERKRIEQTVDVQCKLLDFKMLSLRDILWFKMGRLSITLPEGIDYPKDYQKEEKSSQKLNKKLGSKKKK